MDNTLFVAGSLFLAALMLAAARIVGFDTTSHPDLPSKLPRSRKLGTAVGAACLVWGAFHVIGMLEGGMMRFRPVVIAAVPVLTTLCFFHLDYLFARSLGGLMLLLTTYLLHAAFVVRLPMRGIYSLGCYAIGAFALLVVACPWRLRDLLKKASESTRFRKGLSACLGVAGLGFAVFAFLGL